MWIIKKKQLLNLFPRSKSNYTRFAIICAPRSGSIWLHTLLNSHPNMISYGEILRKTHVNHPTQKLPILNKLIFYPHHASIKAVGLKLFYSYLNDNKFGTSFQEALDDPGILIIHLIRKDILGQFVSLKKAQQDQQWSKARALDNNNSIFINPEEYVAHRKELLASQHNISHVFENHPFLEITYEELLAHRDETLNEIQQFLGVKPRKLFSLLQKQSSGFLKDRIKNWVDIKDLK